jgi:hypothetical protein
VANPGAVTLHNYPNFLRNLKRPAQFGVEEIVDLASIDILRDRERGVPRYNRFLRLFHKPPIASFDDFKNPAFPKLGEELRRVYGTTADGRDNVELLDLMVGMFAEVPPAGFGFSDNLVIRPSGSSFSWPRADSRATGSSPATHSRLRSTRRSVSTGWRIRP